MEPVGLRTSCTAPLWRTCASANLMRCFLRGFLRSLRLKEEMGRGGGELERQSPPLKLGGNAQPLSVSRAGGPHLCGVRPRFRSISVVIPRAPWGASSGSGGCRAGAPAYLPSLARLRSEAAACGVQGEGIW